MYVLDMGISAVFVDESVDSIDGVKSMLWRELAGSAGNSGSGDGGGDSE
jgi:hypothetical protein